MPAPDFNTLAKDPEFLGASTETKRTVLSRLFPDFAGASKDVQDTVITKQFDKAAMLGPKEPQAMPTPTKPSIGKTIEEGLLSGASALAKETFYKTVVRPGADVNRLGYSMIGETGGAFMEPEAYKERRVKGGLYGAERLPTELPHGWLEHIGAAASPLEAGLLQTPGGKVIFGLGTVAGAITKNDNVVDAIEGAGGLISLGRDALRAGKLIKRGLQWPFTGAEKAYTAAKGEVVPAEALASKAQEAADAVETHVAEAKKKAALVASTAEDVAQGRLDAAEMEHKATLLQVGTLEEGTKVDTRLLKDKLKLTAGGPTAESVGKILQSVEDDATASMQGSKHPVGVAAKAIKLTEQSEALKSDFAKMGDQIGVKLPAGAKNRSSASAAIIRRRATQYLRSLVEGQGTTSEKAVAKEISMLGVSGLIDLDNGQVFKADTPAKYAEMLRLNKGLRPLYEDVPIGKLTDLYVKAREVGLSPREFPVTQKAGSRRFSQLTNSLRFAINSLATATPELHEGFLNWQRHVRRIEQPFIRETASKILSPGVTPRKAFETLMVDDPTALERYIGLAKGPERDAILHAAWDEVVNDASKGETITDFKALAKKVKSLPTETQHLMASWSNGAAKMVLDEAQVRSAALEAGKTATKEAALMVKEQGKELRRTKVRARRWNEGLQSYHKEILERAKTDVQITADALAKAQSKAERLGSLKVFAPEGTIKAAETGPVLGYYPQGSYRMFAKAHAVMGIVDILHGNVIRAVMQGGEALIFRRNKLVREALETPVNTPRGKEVALALYLTMRPFLGQPINSPSQDNTTQGQFRSRP